MKASEIKLYSLAELDQMSKDADKAWEKFEKIRDARHAKVNSGEMSMEEYQATLEDEQHPAYELADELREKSRSCRSCWKPEVGNGATLQLWSDAHACTIIKVSKSGRQFTMRQDNAILDPNFKCDITPGGFAGHCNNNHAQSYTYEPNENGREYTVRWTKSGWSTKGTRVTEGRHEFYDYNF